MKKRLSLLLLALLFLFGCGGGGGELSTLNPGTPGGGTDGGTVTAAPTETITIHFPAVQVISPMALKDTAGFIRTGARLVVRKVENVETVTEIMEEVCDEEDEEDCWSQGTGVFITTYPEIETYKNVSDGVLVNGGGDVSIGVPAGTGYTLEVLTYVALAAPDNVNLMWEYGKSDLFNVVSGQATQVSISLSPDLATISLPASPVTAGSSYSVSIENKATALRDGWYIRQALDATDLGDLSDSWFIRDNVNDKGVFGNGAITLQAPTQAGPAPYGQFKPTNQWTLWHHGQFFASDNLLKSGEVYAKWTFGTSLAGPLNPLGEVVVILE